MIEIIPKAGTKAPIWQKGLFYVSVVLIAGVLTGFLYVNFISSHLVEELDDLETLLSRGKTHDERILEQGIFQVRDRMEDFSFLFDDRKVSSAIFPLLEKICHSQTVFSKVSTNVSAGRLQVSGTTQSFQTLAQQLLIFEQEPQVKRVDLAAVSINNEGRVLFNADILFTEEILTF